MRKKLVMTAMMCCFVVSMYAQSTTGISYEKLRFAPSMRWMCPEIEKYQGLLSSLRSDDYKVYAERVKEQIAPYATPDVPDRQFLLTTAMFTIENPLFDIDNMNAWLVGWLKKKGWNKDVKNMSNDGKVLQTVASFNVSSHDSFGNHNKVYVSPTLTFQLVDDNKLFVTFATDIYKIDDFYSDGKKAFSRSTKVTDCYPLNQKSSYKNTFAKAYVGTYQCFWKTISELRNDLNAGFARDAKMLSQLHYQYSQDSLKAKYGEPTKVIADQSTMPDIHKEMRFYESAQKVVFMGKTISFNDIISCEIVDDPKFIPGRTTTYGLGFSIFGIGIGGADSYTTPDKTIHSYVVNVKIDNMSTPLIYIATGQNEQKANEIAAVFEYILRHQTNKNDNRTTQRTKATRRTKR